MKYVLVIVVNREITIFFHETLKKAQTQMKEWFSSYLEEEQDNMDSVDYGNTDCECWITGNYNNVDMMIHEIK